MSLVSEISTIMSEKYGKDISVYDESFLFKTISGQSEIFDRITFSNYPESVAGNKMQAESLLDNLLICYSEFFRNPLTFSVLDQIVFPSLAEEKSAGSVIRIWSAGCSKGQEPYSLAMMLDHVISKQEKKAGFRIFGTDISLASIEYARKGVYPKADLMNVSLRMLTRYTHSLKDGFRVSDEIIQKVDFSVHDLLDPMKPVPAESIYGGFDLVFCSNLLLYYNNITRSRILERLYAAVNPKGYLVTGEAERDMICRSKFNYVAAPAPVFRKK